MPYKTTSKWVPPKRLLSHKGVAVFCTYDDDDIDNGESLHWYTTKAKEDVNIDYSFDVRELSVWKEPPHPPFIKVEFPKSRKQRLNVEWDAYQKSGAEIKFIKEIIRLAIDNGEVRKP